MSDLIIRAIRSLKVAREVMSYPWQECYTRNMKALQELSLRTQVLKKLKGITAILMMLMRPSFVLCRWKPRVR
jgi:hypothetical protein